MNKPSEMKAKIKLRFYFYFKLKTLIFFSYIFDISQWYINFIKDFQDNPKRYIKTTIEPPKMTRDKGGDPTSPN